MPSQHPQIDCFKVYNYAAEIIPARLEREWMGKGPGQGNGAYRCLPMTIANTSGWEILSPCDVEISWAGGNSSSAITIKALDGYPEVHSFFRSDFGSGIFTFVTGYIFRTPEDWYLWVRGAPNFIKDGAMPLEGIVETDWAPFTFTMNWAMTRPGGVRFKKGDPMCFITPHNARLVEVFQPKICSISEDPEFEKEYRAWGDSRRDFLQGYVEKRPDVLKQGWQKNYVRGKTTLGTEAPDTHQTKRRMKAPI